MTQQAAIIPTYEPSGGLQAFAAPARRRLDLDAEIERFLRAADVGEHARRAYAQGLSKFKTFLEDRGRLQPDRQDVIDWRDGLKASGLATTSINVWIVGVRLFFAFLEAERLYPNIARGVKSYRMPSGHLRDAVTADEVLAVLAAIDRSTLSGLRDYAVINTMARLGLRDVEVTRLDVGDIRNVGEIKVLAVRGKGRETADEKLRLTPEVLRPILEYLVERRPCNGDFTAADPLFCSNSDRNRCDRLTTRTVSRIAKEALRRAGIESPRICGHSFRHFFVTHLIEKGVPVQDVQAAARHRSIQTTMRYFHNINRLKNAAELQVSF